MNTTLGTTPAFKRPVLILTPKGEKSIIIKINKFTFELLKKQGLPVEG